MAYDRESLQGLQNFNDEVFFNEKITAFNGISGNVTGNLDGNVTGNLTGNVTGNLTGNVTGDVIGNIVLSGISTFQDLRLNGKFFDGSNTFGSSGQILSSDGTKTSWINASSANVGSATSIGINLDSTNVSRFITFVDTSSGNNIVKVDSDLTYNPSTNTLTAGSFVKSGGTSSQFLKADGTVDSNTYVTETFASGTTLLFYQASAPTGWTKSTSHDNKALRVVSGNGGGSGGSTAFTSVFSTRTPTGSVSVTNNSFTLSNSEIPSHTHEFGADDQIAGQGGYTSIGGFPYDAISNTGGSGQRLRTRTDTNFGGGSHTHNNTANFSGSSMDFAVQYIDIILCSKN